MTDLTWPWLVPLLPLLGSALCGALHFATLRARRAGGHPAGGGSQGGGSSTAGGPAALAPWVASAAVLGSLVCGLVGFRALAADESRVLVSTTWDWIRAGDLVLDVRLVLDRLSSVMVLVVTGVGLLIHVYAAGYMKGDAGYAKFFAYLNLFVAAMLVLVLSSSLLGLFIGWEGVGLCSYLLIGFWYAKGGPAEAGQKAFVMNRVGDACFLVGSFLLVDLFGTLDLAAIGAGTPSALDAGQGTQLLLAALLLFGGACGKSAQLPLFTWLPDAMAGPTPVSALIHAATMVTAGVYLVVRLNPLFAASPGLLLFIGGVGAATAFIAGTTALRQRDLKKVLAYSTVSQLGYMFVALGAGAWGAAIFHLVTHAFFKALLFLGAGSVIHGMHDEQDMHRMGGLRRHMPVTFATFLAGAAALSGLPLLSGFFSKDEILAHAFVTGGAYYLPWLVGLATAAITAFYTWRMVALTFFGEERFDVQRVHPHESPAVMTAPLVVLALLSVTGGALGLPPVLHAPHLLGEWLQPVTAPGDALLHGGHAPHLSHALEWVLLGVGAAVALVFSHLGFRAFRAGTERDEAFARARPELARLFGDAWGIDRAYQRFVVQPVKVAGFVVAVVIDRFAVDGTVDGLASGTRSLGGRLRGMADGSVTTYALWMGGAAVLLAGLWSFWGGVA